MALKPIPKAIGIVLIVAAVGFGATKFLPKSEPKPEVAEQVQPARTEKPVVVQPQVRSESDALTRANEATDKAREAQAARDAVLPEPESAPTVSNGGKGLDALLKAGKK